MSDSDSENRTPTSNNNNNNTIDEFLRLHQLHQYARVLKDNGFTHLEDLPALIQNKELLHQLIPLPGHQACFARVVARQAEELARQAEELARQAEEQAEELARRREGLATFPEGIASSINTLVQKGYPSIYPLVQLYKCDKESLYSNVVSDLPREHRALLEMAICDRLSPHDSFSVRSGCISSRSSSKNSDARRDAENTYFRDVKDASCTPHPTRLEVKKALDAIGISVALPEELAKSDPEERKWLEHVLVSSLFRAAFRVVCIRLHMSVSDEDVTTAANEYIQRLFIEKVNRPGLYGVTLPHPPCTFVARRRRAEMRITCLHEAAHFIRRWATNSTISTPRAAKLGDAEAGEILERVMFGGVLGQHQDSIIDIEARLDKVNFSNPTTARLYLMDDMPNVSSGSSATGAVQKKVSFQ